MIKRKGVSLVVDEKFFRTFELEREKEQSKLRNSLGRMFNLTQRNFSAMLVDKNFRFKVQKRRRIL